MTRHALALAMAMSCCQWRIDAQDHEKQSKVRIRLSCQWRIDGLAQVLLMVIWIGYGIAFTMAFGG